MRAAIDTNVLVYAEGIGAQERIYQTRSLLAEAAGADLVIPTQCLTELFRVLIKKGKWNASAARDAVLGWMDAFPCAETTPESLAGAMDLCVEHRLSCWDALILNVAADSQARLFITEDLQPGFTWRGVRVVNPYAEASDPLLNQWICGQL